MDEGSKLIGITSYFSKNPTTSKKIVKKRLHTWRPTYTFLLMVSYVSALDYLEFISTACLLSLGCNDYSFIGKGCVIQQLEFPLTATFDGDN